MTQDLVPIRVSKASQKKVRRLGHDHKLVELTAGQLKEVGEGNTKRPAYKSVREHAHVGG